MPCIVIDVYDGSLAPGDTVTIVLGDRSQGSPGIRAQTFVETVHEFRVLVDPTNACVVRPVPGCPTFPVIAGETVELVCVARRDTVFVRGQDQWGNPTPRPADVTTTRHDDVWVAHSESLKLSARSNPIPFRDSRYKPFWGDLHAQSGATVGTGTEEEYFRFARDIARLDFCSQSLERIIVNTRQQSALAPFFGVSSRRKEPAHRKAFGLKRGECNGDISCSQVQRALQRIRADRTQTFKPAAYDLDKCLFA